MDTPKTVLIIEGHTQFLDFFSINLLTWTGSNCIGKTDGKFAIDYLHENSKDVTLILTRAKIDSEHTAEAIFEYITDKNLNIPLIIIGNSPLTKQHIPHLDSALDIKTLVQACAKELNVTAKAMAKLSVPDYFEIPIQHFDLLKETCCDIYKVNNSQYEIYLHAFDEISHIALKKYATKEHPYLYIAKEDRLKFVSNINQEIVSQLSFKDLAEDEQITAVEMSQELLQEKLARLGITPETVALAQKNLKFMCATAKKSPNLKLLLKRLLSNKAAYQFKHSQILMFVASHLMKELDWGNEEQEKKLQFISFFHDITLRNSEQCQIHSEAQLRESSFCAKEKEFIKKHAQVCATLISKYPHAPLGAEQIIKQHHGMVNGLGFSEHYSQSISPMAIVFILAEDLVDELLTKGTRFNYKNKISQMRKSYSTQRFQKIIDALESLILK